LDVSLLAADPRLISERLRRRGRAAALRYEHAAPHEHPLLWVSDAIAWCLQAGGDWPRRIAFHDLERHDL